MLHLLNHKLFHFGRNGFCRVDNPTYWRKKMRITGVYWKISDCYEMLSRQNHKYMVMLKEVLCHTKSWWLTYDQKHEILNERQWLELVMKWKPSLIYKPLLQHILYFNSYFICICNISSPFEGRTCWWLLWIARCCWICCCMLGIS